MKKLFDKNISSEATITTDKWKGYRPLMEQYDITQINSNNGSNFKALHTMIHQVKYWIRTTYSWVCVTESYLEDFEKELDEAIKRAEHIHARVGFLEGATNFRP